MFYVVIRSQQDVMPLGKVHMIEFYHGLSFLNPVLRRKRAENKQC